MDFRTEVFGAVSEENTVIDIVTCRGTGEPGNSDETPAGMPHDVTKPLDPGRLACFEPDRPASVGSAPEVRDPAPDMSVCLGIAAR